MSNARSIANEWRVILLGLYFFALPFGNSFQLIGIIMAVIGVADVLRGKVSLKEPVFRWLAVLFLLYWLPMAVSLITTVDFSKSLETVLASLRYLFIGVFIIRSLKSRWLFSHLNLFLFAAVSVWLIDATFQLLMGVNTFDQVLESYASGPFE
ncbi:MAG: hypothetical protein SVC26_08685, partial [Pseudomonadota bacterium]|nr:hypothetical protein [Pseudomonadota bacterium]